MPAFDKLFYYNFDHFRILDSHRRSLMRAKMEDVTSHCKLLNNISDLYIIEQQSLQSYSMYCIHEQLIVDVQVHKAALFTLAENR